VWGAKAVHHIKKVKRSLLTVYDVSKHSCSFTLTLEEWLLEMQRLGGVVSIEFAIMENF